jgi:hypothetical protein
MAPGTISQSTFRTVMLWKPRILAISRIRLPNQWVAVFYEGKIGKKPVFVAQKAREGNP